VVVVFGGGEREKEKRGIAGARSNYQPTGTHTQGTTGDETSDPWEVAAKEKRVTAGERGKGANQSWRSGSIPQSASEPSPTSRSAR